jgi:hypothetical protein
MDFMQTGEIAELWAEFKQKLPKLAKSGRRGGIKDLPRSPLHCAYTVFNYLFLFVFLFTVNLNASIGHRPTVCRYTFENGQYYGRMSNSKMKININK